MAAEKTPDQTPTPDPPKKKKVWQFWPPQWYWFTRLMGSVLIVYGVFGDHTPERSTIILVGAGLAGFDKVKGKDETKK